MSGDELSTKKWVLISQIKPGVYVAGLDRSWLQTPFLLHQKLVREPADIERLEKYGIRRVMIDTARGADVDGPPAEPPPAARLARSTDELKSDLDNSHAALSESAFQHLVKELETARAIHDQAAALAQNIFAGLGSGAGIDTGLTVKVIDALAESVTCSPEANLLVIQMRRFQTDLFTHAVNVSVLCLVVGMAEGIARDPWPLGLGALLHDVGQTRLPRNLIRKRQNYTEPERNLLEQHPALGEALLKNNRTIPLEARQIVARHHERVDGSGYPLGIRRAEISLLTQIVGVTDVYDEMLTGCFQPALPPVEVLRQLYLQAKGGAFDCELIERIIRCLGVYPVGSFVELNTGERGIVIAANKTDSLKPTVRLISSFQGAPQLKGPIISLADEPADDAGRRIVRALDPGQERLDLLSYLRPVTAFSG